MSSTTMASLTTATINALTAPAEMLISERLLLFALVLGLRPKSVLEIGVFAGGSSAIILEALAAVGQGGALYSVEPNELPPAPHNSFWVTVRGKSPDDLAHIAGMSPHPFDFVLIDGDHSYEAVLADIEGVIPYLAETAYLLFHDACNPEVREAIGAGVARHNGWMADCGLLCNTSVRLEHMQADYYGMRLVRFQRG